LVWKKSIKQKVLFLNQAGKQRKKTTEERTTVKERGGVPAKLAGELQSGKIGAENRREVKRTMQHPRLTREKGSKREKADEGS